MHRRFKFKLTYIALLLTLISHPVVGAETEQCPDNLNFKVRTLNDDRVVDLCNLYQGKVVLIVNTASKCGYTGQYEQLETLYETYKQQGLVVLGFPSNDFGGQEPGTEKQIQSFCVNTYAVKFPMFQKTSVKKNNADPLYKQLGDQSGYPRWNFHKYLLDRDGQLVESYNSPVSPTSDKIVSKIQSLLTK